MSGERIYHASAFNPSRRIGGISPVIRGFRRIAVLQEFLHADRREGCHDGVCCKVQPWVRSDICRFFESAM
jgi:hypothetical protein